MSHSPPLPHKPIDLVAPQGGQWIEIQKDIFWIRMPLPMRLNHINLWALRDDDGWTLIDTGLYYDKCHRLWLMILEELQRVGPIKRIIATHHHPDHVGNAGWLVQETGADFWMSESEWLGATLLLNMSSDIIGQKMARMAKLLGLDDEKIEMMGNLGAHFQVASGDLPMRYHRIMDNMEIPINGINWRVIVGYGHALEHVSLYAKDLKCLIAGDHVLPEITPNISTHWFNGWVDPLGGFLNTNQKLLNTLPDEILVLPSHRQPFHGLHQRLYELKQHHMDRLEDTRQALRDLPDQIGQAADVLKVMFKMDLDGFGLMFAIGEAEAHLRHLVAIGEAELLGNAKDPLRPWRYRLTS